MIFARTHARTDTCSLIVAIAALALTATAAHAQITSPVPSGTFHLFSIPGLINDGGLGTIFGCSSTSTIPQTVTVEAFDENGNPGGAASLIVAAGQTVMFGTRGALGVTVAPGGNLASPAIVSGAARILSTDKKLLCTATVIDALTSPPAAGWQLTIVAKLKQKAAN